MSIVLRYMQIEYLFFELIRVAIGMQESLSRFPSEAEWKALLGMAVKQSLVGVCFAGLHSIGADSNGGFTKIGMSKSLFLKWMCMAAWINMRNEVMNGYTMEALSFFRDKGIPCQVLKGQGIAKLYTSTNSVQVPIDLRSFRQSGDIDVWIAGDKDKALAISKEVLGKVEGLTNYHIHFPILNDVEIELHFKPSFLSSPFRNRRLLDFCKRYEPQAGCGDEPSLAFNRVYILLHCYRHLCGHGIGMRQVLDYFFVLRQGFTEEEKTDSMKWISALGMMKFCKAMMWLMKYILGLDDRYLLCPTDENDGRFLIDEVLHSGNMGHGEDRFDGGISGSAVSRYWYNLKRDVRLLKFCPHEALWDPFYNVYQYVWCKMQSNAR